MDKEIKVRVFRYDSGKSRYQDYEVRYTPPVTILDLLRLINQEQDPCLAFRSSCGMGKCGSCALSVNGKPVLSCQEVVKGEEILIEPLPNFPVVKDLIVARDRYEERMISVLEAEPAFPLLPPRPSDDPIWPECVECLACDGACPLVAEIPQRYLGPALMAGTADLKKATPLREWESAYHCLLCGECTAICPSKVRMDDILLEARKESTRRGRLPLSLQRLGRNIATTHNISGQENQSRLLWKEEVPSRFAEGAQTLYFVGCLASLFPSLYGTPRSFAALLEASRVDYGLLDGEEWCCGYPLILNGMMEEAKEVATHNLQKVKERGVKRVVMTCPSCYYTWREGYKALTGEETGVEVVHATQLLAELLDKKRLRIKGLSMKVTYHDPCDLGRKSWIYEAPRRILESIPGLTLVEMRKNREEALCCGGGGNLESYAPEIMAAIAQERLREAEETSAEAIVTACPQCQRTLREAARKLRAYLPVFDVVELLWRALEAS